MTKVINLTPHDINILKEGKTILVLPRSGTIARVIEHNTQADALNIDGVAVPMQIKDYGTPIDLPDPVDNVYYVVSLLTAQTSGRQDLLIVADSVRNEQGQIIGCTGLARLGTQL